MSFRTAFLLLTAFLIQPALADPNIVPVGAGSFARVRPKTAKGPQAEIYATPAVKGKMPTNDWWSSLAWMPFSERHYPHPLAVEACAGGLRVFYPGHNITASKDAVFGFMPAKVNDDFVLGHSRQPTFPDARVHGFSDWFVSAKFAAENRSLVVSYGHGSPFVFARYEGGGPRLVFATPPQVTSGDKDSPVLRVIVGGKHYGLFGPSGSTWTGLGTDTLTSESDKDYFSVAILPDDKPETLALFKKHAFAHVTDTQVGWSYDEKAGAVNTTFSVTTVSHEGQGGGTLLALYPHQWKHTTAKPLGLSYGSVRGELKLIEGSKFQTSYPFAGVLPSLPNVGGCDAARMLEFLKAESGQEMPPPGKDTYWDGKWLGKTASLIPIAQQFDQPEIAEKLRQRLRQRLEGWFTAADEKGQPKPSGLFCYDENWGTLIGYPASYGSDTELNDHHFHYGYFIRAAAEIARVDPDWAGSKRWGPMVEQLIRNIAADTRDDPSFPFLRNFDPYAGHTWASGHSKFGDGNNNESSSEAMNAWYGLILWGEFTGNRKLRDLGVYLYTTEMQAIHEYWFDIHDTNHPPSFTPSVVTMVWGGKGANGTWFTANPEAVHGINWLPIHGGSLYLGHSAAYAEKNYSALQAENGGKPWDEWADLIWMYRALSDPGDALKQFDAGHRTLPGEGGNSLANAYHWIGALNRLGRVNAAVTADFPLVAVFDNAKTRSYVVYHQGGKEKTVSFSDGFKAVVKDHGTHTLTREMK